MTVHPISLPRRSPPSKLPRRAMAVVILTVNITIAACSSTQPSTVEAPTFTRELTPVTGTIGHGAAAVTITTPKGWTNIGWGLIKGDPAVGVLAMEVRNTYTDTCPAVALDPPVGPSVDDLASVWHDLPAFNASAPTDVTVDGFDGKQVDLTIPDYDEADCPYGEFMLLQDNSGQDGYWAQAPNQHHQLWILDVDGIRLVIAGFWYPDTSAEDRAEIDEILSSIQIG